MVVVHQVVATASSYDIKVVTARRPYLSRCHTGAVKLVVGILHLVSAEDGFQTTLIKRLIVRH